MSLKSLFIAPPNTSACTGGMCRSDPACSDKHCPGKLLAKPAFATQDGGATVDSGIVMIEPDSMDTLDRIWSVIGWTCLVVATACAFAFATLFITVDDLTRAVGYLYTR